MAAQASNQRTRKHTAPNTLLDPSSAYHASMVLLRNRFANITQNPSGESSLMRAERIALQVRKIVEGVAYSCLSAVEHRNHQTLREQRTKDADKLLGWLEAKKLLRLPNAQRLKPPPSSEYKIVAEGATDYDLDTTFLKAAYSRSSELIHECHP